MFLSPGREPRVLVVLVGGLLRLSADDERRARLVDEDGVDLVDDRVVQLALDALRELAGHVVAQVVEAELVVRAVRDVAGVGLLAAHRPEVAQALVGVALVDVLGVVDEAGQLAGRARHDDADREPEQVVDRAHPARVAAGEVVVHRDQVGAPAAEAVQVESERRDQRLALAGLHLGDLAEMEHDAPDQLDVEVAQTEGAA
jgi:hypothetical protein